ncbi:uncharacterized protein A1O9_12006 [Exophiala aquamarina CBS 119918]|uniref:RRM domain-containing protein n=1 Tax=Exophiala aquamarina CBS 119918 TaxID=1182545 RepID=A0A072NWL6_9EURO|nr:uncharacterized protein A1O9_12006 [Exophiala aquamarina CBS 119918]KEF52016.1 hypothetical protein A1O9_12006 [Exophiala aquamarina CBS 119918]
MSSKTAQAPKGKETPSAGAPNQTLYIKNLNDKINKNELKRALYMLFTTHGPVLDVVTNRVGSKAQSMRGQAHVVFRDVQTSTQAMRALQGFELFDREMVIAYARGQSQIIPKLRGTFEPPTASTTAPGTTDLQKSIFSAPPGAVPAKPVENGVNQTEETAATVPHGIKRTREEEESDENEVSMEEDEDDASMEEDDDD